MDLPQYDVITPQTNKTFTLRTMTVAEEMKLKGSLITPEQIVSHVTAVLYDCIVNKPEDIKDIKDFMTKVTTHDRQALLFGLFHVTHGEIQKYPVESCKGCGKSYEYNFPTDSLCKITQYEGEEDILTMLVEVKLPISKLSCFIKQPTIRDEIVAAKTAVQIPHDKEFLDELIFVEKFTKGAKEFSEIMEKLSLFKALPSKDRRVLWQKYTELFGQYQVKVSGEAVCPFCKTEIEINIDFMEIFFRMVYEQ